MNSLENLTILYLFQILFPITVVVWGSSCIHSVHHRTKQATNQATWATWHTVKDRFLANVEQMVSDSTPRLIQLPYKWVWTSYKIYKIVESDSVQTFAQNIEKKGQTRGERYNKSNRTQPSAEALQQTCAAVVLAWLIKLECLESSVH